MTVLQQQPPIVNPVPTQTDASANTTLPVLVPSPESSNSASIIVCVQHVYIHDPPRV